jgi:hypothetical protein
VRPLLKAGLIAAAVITIGFAFLFSSSPAGAVTIEQICQAIQKAKNVYIAKFNPGKVKPDQERWVSRSLNVYLTKTGNESVLRDLGKKVLIEKNFNAGSIKTSPLSTETITATETMMNGLLGLVPFADVSVIPEDAEWDQVGNDDLQTISKTIEIYEMKWLKRTYAGATIFNRWLFFIDPKTNLPQKIESYIKSATDNEYALLSTFEVKYLRGREMKAVVDEASL